MSDEKPPEQGTPGAGPDSEASDSATGATPILRIVARGGRKISIQQYEQLWTLYRDGMRVVLQLSKKTGISRAVIKYAIERGWPDRNWAGLRERAILWDKQRAEESERAAAESFRERADAVYRVQKRTLGRLDHATDIGYAALELVRRAFEAATFTKTRRVRRQVGDKVEELDEDYIPAREVAMVFRAVAASVRDLGTYEKAWLTNALVPGVPGAGAGTGGDGGAEDRPPVRPMTAAEIRTVIETKQLPPGCTDEQLIATLQQVADQTVKGAAGK